MSESRIEAVDAAINKVIEDGGGVIDTRACAIAAIEAAEIFSGPLYSDWSWINSDSQRGRLGNLFGGASLILDGSSLIYGRSEHGRAIAAVPNMLEALRRIRGWREIDRRGAFERLAAIEEIADQALNAAAPVRPEGS